MSRSRLAPFGVAVLAVSISVAAFPIGNALIGDRDRQEPRLRAAPADADDDGSAVGSGRLTTATSCADLLSTLTTQGAELVGPWGWEYGPMPVGYWAAEDQFLRGATSSVAASPEATSQRSSQTGTNVQETGVDEPDLAKTDGRILARIDSRTVRIYDLTTDPERPQEIAALKLPGRRVNNAELLLSGNRLFVVGTTWQRATARTAAITVDLADPARPRIENTRLFDGDLLSARLTGDDLRVVTSSGLPELDFVRPTKNRTRKEAKAQNKAVVAASKIEDWLPQFSVGSTRRNLVDCAQVNVPDQASELGMLNIVGFRADAVDPAEISTTSVLTRSRIVYTSLDRLYLATGSFGWWCCDMWVGSSVPLDRGRRSEPITTELHAFALDGTEADYLASGEVDGQIQDRWAMDSADGVLRVATSISTEQGKKRARRTVRSHSVLTLGERGGRLVELGSVDGLGVNEEIQSVRWFDDSAYLVTFRQIDPLYAIDLRDPERPQLLGELKIPGFSSYLHPIGEGRLLGLGTDATARGRSLGAQASVFDVTDPSRPKQVAKQRYGRTTEFSASWEPRQFTWLPEQQTALAALSDWRGASRMSIVAIKVADDGTFTSTEVPVTGGWRSYNVRTVPLPDGRVVVTSKATTAFLEW